MYNMSSERDRQTDRGRGRGRGGGRGRRSPKHMYYINFTCREGIGYEVMR